MRKIVIIVVLLLAGAAVLGYGRHTKNMGEASKTRLVTDGASRQVTIPVRPQRVIALNSSNIDLYYGAGGQVIARPSRVTMSEAVMEKIEGLPVIGESGSPSIEKLVALKPDLVVGLNMSFHQLLAQPLEEAGIPLLLISPGNYENIIELLEFYGQLSGKPEKARETINGLERKRAGALEKKDGNSRRALLLFGTPGSYSMAMPESFSGGLLELLGSENVAAGHTEVAQKAPYITMNMEFVVKSDPDIILLITHGGYSDNNKMRKTLEKNSAWQQLKAVKAGEVYVLPYHLFGINPGTQTGEAIEYLASVLYGTGTKGDGENDG